MLSKHNPTRALAASLAAATVAAVAGVTARSPLAADLRSPIARETAPAPAQKYGRVLTGGVRAPDRLAPDAAHGVSALAPTTRARTSVPTVVEITPARGFDWTSAGIGAAGGIALTLIALAGAATVTSRSSPASH